MSRLNQAVKLTTINLLVIAGILFIPAVVFEAYKQIKLNSQGKSAQESEPLKIYRNKQEKNEVEKMQNEAQTAQPMAYVPFIGWRRPLSNQKYNQIISPYNQRNSVSHALNQSSWFFGNSTMWGTGTTENYTIPSQYSKITGKSVANFGESAWTSRQSVNQLLNVIGDGYQPDEVIFYGGAGDILQNCRAELEHVPSHAMGQKLAGMTSSGINYFLLKDYILPVVDFIVMPYKAIGGKLGIYKNTVSTSGSTMDCTTNQEKAKRVVDHLIANWKAAYLISKANGADFLAVLQPLAYTSDTPTNHLPNEDKLLTSQFDALYPAIVQAMANECASDPEFCSSFVDGSQWIQTKEPIFLDFSHITGEGNSIVAQEIANSFNQRSAN